MRGFTSPIPMRSLTVLCQRQVTAAAMTAPVADTDIDDLEDTRGLGWMNA